MPVPVSHPNSGGMVPPSTFEKAKMGALMGTSVGLIIGFIFGATNIIRYGPGSNGMLRQLGQYMAGSAATFGFFMSIGTTIRTESNASGKRLETHLAQSMRYPAFHNFSSSQNVKLSRSD